MLLPAGGIPARFPACLLLPIAAGTDACRMLCAKPAVELPVMTLHAGLFGPPLAPFCRFNVKRVWLACRLHAGTTGRICLLAPCGHVLPKPVASCSTFSLLLLAEVTIIFRRKDSSLRFWETKNKEYLLAVLGASLCGTYFLGHRKIDLFNF